MSTRCNVIIRSKNAKYPSDRAQLYRHCDGYPEEVLPSLLAGYNLAAGASADFGARPQMAAAFLIASSLALKDTKDPYSSNYVPYEPEEYGLLHGDIEFFYLITPSRDGDELIWHVEVREPTWRGFQDPNEGKEKATRLLKGGDIREIGQVETKDED
jgi:hypothetical protein